MAWTSEIREDGTWFNLIPLYSGANSIDWTAPDLLDAILLDKSFDEASESYFNTLEKFFADVPGRGWSGEPESSSSFANDSPTSLEWDKDPVQSVTWS